MEFDGARAYEYTRVLTKDIGSRFAGQDGEKKGAEYVLKTFKEFGYEDARLQPFPIDLYEAWDEKLTVDGLGNVPCVGILGGEDCPDGITGELKYVEGGEPANLGPDCRDKILMICGDIGPMNKYKNMLAHKPRAIIVLDGSYFRPPCRNNLSHERKKMFGSVPMVRVAYEYGKKMWPLSGKTATLSLRSTYRESTAYNIICDLPGTEDSKDIIVVCGHVDSIYDSPGAIDNATGTSCVMELARIFKKIGSKRHLRFIAFSGEEQGLRGSVYYVRELRKADKVAKKDKEFALTGQETELDHHRLVVNIDIQGTMPGTSGAIISGPSDLTASVRLLAAENGPAQSVSEGCYSSDNAPFGDAGVPSISWGRGGPDGFYGHTCLDAFEQVSQEGLKVAGAFILKWMRRYITEPLIIPFERTIPDDQKTQISNYFKERAMLRLDDGMDD
jgi:hypothetical protein